MLLLTWVHLGKLESVDDTLNGPSVSKGACELKLHFSVSSRRIHLISWQIQCSMNSMSPSTRPWGTGLHCERQVSLGLLLARFRAQQSRQFSNHLEVCHLVNEGTAGVNIKSQFGVNTSLLEIKLYCTVFYLCTGMIFPW